MLGGGLNAQRANVITKVLIDFIKNKAIEKMAKMSRHALRRDFYPKLRHDLCGGAFDSLPPNDRADRHAWRARLFNALPDARHSQNRINAQIGVRWPKHNHRCML